MHYGSLGRRNTPVGPEGCPGPPEAAAAEAPNRGWASRLVVA